MKDDDLQKMIDDQLHSAKQGGGPKKSFSKNDIDNIILTPEETKIPKNSAEEETAPTEDDVEKEIPNKVVDLDNEFGVEKQKPIPVKNIPEKAPKTIADLLSIEANVAKNPPTTKTRPQSHSENYVDRGIVTPQSSIDKIKENLKDISYSPKIEASTIVKKLRTLEGDIAEAMRSGKTTIASFVSSENNKATITPPPGVLNTDKGFHFKNSISLVKIISILVGVLLLLGGGYALYYIMIKEKEPIITAPKPTNDGPLMVTQFEVKIDTEKHNSSYLRASIATERKQSSGNLNEVGDVILTKSGIFKEEKLNTQEFVRALQMRMPPELLRTLYPNYMLGIHRFSENQSFLIFKTDSYDTARAGMLSWEKDLEEDVGKLLRSSGEFNYATSSEATTNRRIFRDETIKNQDARVVYDENNNFLFLYTFLKDRETIVFVSHPETLAEVLNGLSARKVVE